MSIISPILDGAAQVAEALGTILAPLFETIGPGAGGLGDAADGGLGMMMSGLAGVAAALLVALLVAILLSIYFRSGYRSTADIVKHGVATALLLGLLGFAVYDMRHDVRDYFGLNAQPAVAGTNLPDTGLFGSRVSPPAPPPRWMNRLSI